jgi:hypothetical protein
VYLGESTIKCQIQMIIEKKSMKVKLKPKKNRLYMKLRTYMYLTQKYKGLHVKWLKYKSKIQIYLRINV